MSEQKVEKNQEHACDRGPCWMERGHDGPCEPGSRNDSRRQTPINVIHIEESWPTPTPHPCEVGQHRWAWLNNGGQACGYCGRPR